MLLCIFQSSDPRHGVLVWQDFKTAVVLKKIIRQEENEKELRDVLSSLREYRATPNQAQWLQQFQWNNLKITHGEKLLERMSQSGLFVIPTHEEEWNHNEMKLSDVNKMFPVAKINSVSKGPHSKTNESKKSGGLIDTLYICKNL